MNFVRVLLKDFLEPFLARSVGRFFWPPIAVTVVAHGENEDILALDQDGGYALPGGLVDMGDESLKQTARRELHEETGFTGEIGNLLDVRKNSRIGTVEFFFEAEITGGEKSGSWEGEPVFLPKDKINELVWRPEHRHVEEYLFPD